MSELWSGVVGALESALRFFHGLVDPFAPGAAWGWAIVLLTVAVRVVLLPLAIKQTTSMRAMQSLQPELKKIQAKHKVDRSLMKTDPAKFQEKRRQQQEATMALYKEHGVNPAAGCLPLVLQMPIFLALFNLLSRDRVEQLEGAGFYLVESLTTPAREAAIGGWLLIILMAATTFLSQKQMMAANPASAAQAQQQKILLYVMPVMLTFFAFNVFAGVLLYWVTTNLWTMGQQYVMFRGARAAAAPAPVTPARAKKA